jgi:hypothetical protein
MSWSNLADMEGTQSILKIYGEQEEAGPFGGSFDLCPPAAVAGHHMPSIMDDARGFE